MKYGDGFGKGIDWGANSTWREIDNRGPNGILSDPFFGGGFYKNKKGGVWKCPDFLVRVTTPGVEPHADVSMGLKEGWQNSVLSIAVTE